MTSQKIIVFVDEINERLKFTFDVLFESKGIEIQLINDSVLFEQSSDVKLVYSDYPFSSVYPTISPSNLLFENNIRNTVPKKATWNGEEVLLFDKKADIIASAFYILSLYHEYGNVKKDHHDRVVGAGNFLAINGWLRKLIIEEWAQLILNFINQKNSVQFEFQKLNFEIVPTFDIDHAYAYKYKSALHTMGSKMKDLVRFDQARIKERKLVLQGLIKDPYDTYDQIKIIKEKGFKVILFWLLGNYSEYDRNLSWTNSFQKRLIRSLAIDMEIGLHPSYGSNQMLGILADEKQRLETILDQKVFKSRQHFLKLNIQSTYSTLLQNGFTDDYSLVYHDLPGFRAGIARPFPWFDLNKNKISALTLHPVTYMDATYKNYLKMSVEEAKADLQVLAKEIKKYGGNLIAIWHNESIGDYRDWKGWANLLDFTLALNKN